MKVSLEGVVQLNWIDIPVVGYVIGLCKCTSHSGEHLYRGTCMTLEYFHIAQIVRLFVGAMQR